MGKMLRNILCLIILVIIISCKPKTVAEVLGERILRTERIPAFEINQISDATLLQDLSDLIYARNGRPISSEARRARFLQQPWASALKNRVPTRMSEIDRENLATISESLAIVKLKESIGNHAIASSDLKPDEKKIMGTWALEPVPGPNLAESYTFYPNRKFVHRPDSRLCAERLIFRAGTWTLENKILVLKYFAEARRYDGEMIPGDGPCGNQKYQLIGAEARYLPLLKPVIETHETSEITDFEPIPGKQTLTIGGHPYYNKLADPLGYDH